MTEKWIVYKYALSVTGVTALELDDKSTVLKVANQRGKPMLWVLEPAESEQRFRHPWYFAGVVTGERIELMPGKKYELGYLDTILFDDGNFVVHYFLLEGL